MSGEVGDYEVKDITHMNLNVRKIKYVIAREGLIVMCLMAAASIAYYGDYLCNSKIDNYVKTAKEIELVKKLSPLEAVWAEAAAKTTDPFETARARISAATKIQFPKSTTEEVIRKTLDRDFLNKVGVLDRLAFLYEMEVSDQPSNFNIRNRYDDKGNKLFTGLLWQIDFLKIMSFFLFIAYPLYLLGRFVSWAVITVKSYGTTC